MSAAASGIPSRRAGFPQQRWIPDGLGRRHSEQQASRVVRDAVASRLGEALLDAGRHHRHRHRQSRIRLPVARGSGPGATPSGPGRFPCVSTTIRSSTRSSSGAGRTDSSSMRASRRPRGFTLTPEAGQRAGLLSGSEHKRDPLGQQAAGHESQPRWPTPGPSHWASSTATSSGRSLGEFLGEQAEHRQSDQKRIRRRAGAWSLESHPERVALRLRGDARWPRGQPSRSWCAARIRQLQLRLDTPGPAQL